MPPPEEDGGGCAASIELGNWLGDASKSSMVMVATRIVEPALQPHLPATIHIALELERVLVSSWLVTEGALGLAREEVTSGLAVALLPGWAGDSSAIDEP